MAVLPVLPDFEAAKFKPGAPIDNPYSPQTPGTVTSFGGTKIDEDTGESEVERNDEFVTFETKKIEGVQTTVVRDTEYVDGVLAEDTIDWYAQDTDGNVWYLGEATYSFNYDDDGNFIGSETDGAWEAGVDGALPGFLMPADPEVGFKYYQEFDEGNAEDEALVLTRDAEIEVGGETFTDVLKTQDTTALEPDVLEFKYYAPGVGFVRTEEDVDENGVPGFVSERLDSFEVGGDDHDEGRRGDGKHGKGERGRGKRDDDDDEVELGDLQDGRMIDPSRIEEPDAKDFTSKGGDKYVTFVSESGDFNNAIGAYTFDRKSGEIGEGRILFAETEELESGTNTEIAVAKGQGLGIFMLANSDELGVDLESFEEGGLFFSNFITGGLAALNDGLAPLISNADGEILPLQGMHALGGDDGINFLNPGTGAQAIELESDDIEDAVKGDVELIGFEDRQLPDPDYDGDFNDVVIAFSDAPIDADIWA